MQGRNAHQGKKIRSSHQRCSVKKGVLRNFAKFTGKHLCQSLFFNKVAGAFFTEHICFLNTYSPIFEQTLKCPFPIRFIQRKLIIIQTKFWYYLIQFRTSHPEVFCKKGVLGYFAKFIGKHLCQSLFLLRPATLLKKRLWYRYFPVNFGKFLRTPFLTKYLRWLLLSIMRSRLNCGIFVE